MAGIITGLFGLIGTTIKYTLITGVAVGIAGVCTKPTEESFHPYYSAWLKSQVANSGGESTYGKVLLGSAVSTVASYTTVPQFRDFVVCKGAQVKHGQESLDFVGCFNGWYSLPQTSQKVYMQ